MKCSDLQFNLSLYPDGLNAKDLAELEDHRAACPVCRQKSADLNSIRQDLRSLSPPEIPLAIERRIREQLFEEAATAESRTSVIRRLRQLLELQVTPYVVGVAASLVIGMTVLTSLFSGGIRLAGAPAPARDAILLATNAGTDYSGHAVITPVDFANARLGLGAESPSLNPQGALVALTRSLVRGEMHDDEVVVVADVFGNGLASIEQVVHPSRNRRVVDELQKALDAGPSSSPFLPSRFESRPESVRVVFRFQSVDVPIGLRANRQSL